MRSFNIIGHLYNPSRNNDKVYMSCIRYDHGEWKVIGKWGRREKGLSSMVKGTFSSIDSAFSHQRTIWNEKNREGYLDIDSKEYLQNMMNMSARSSMVSRNTPGVKENLESENPNQSPIKLCSECGEPIGLSSDLCQKCNDKKKAKEFEALTKALKEQENKPQEDEMYCIDNSGMENFDLGVEYVVEYIVGNDEMMHAYDKYGEKVQVFRARFASNEQMKHRAKFGVKEDSIFFKVLKSRTGEATGEATGYSLDMANLKITKEQVDNAIKEEYSEEEIDSIGLSKIEKQVVENVRKRLNRESSEPKSVFDTIEEMSDGELEKELKRLME